MKRILSIFLLITVLALSLVCFASCNAAETVNHNLSVKADNFECLRRITVYNARTDLIVLEIEGYMSLQNNTHSELVVTCKVGDDQYKKNYVYLNDYVIYVVEDITGTETDPYHYQVIFYTPVPDVEVNPE